MSQFGSSQTQTSVFNNKIMPQNKTYQFDQFNVSIVNPSVEVVGIYDKLDVCGVDIVLSLGSVNNKSVSFGVRLDGFTYTGDWTREEVDAWVEQELIKYEQ